MEYRSFWWKGLVGVFFGWALIITACSQPPLPPPPRTECNPVPAPDTTPPLPDFVESVSYQGPEVYGPVNSIFAVGEMLFVGLGDSLAIMDASTRAAPELLGRLQLNNLSSSDPIQSFAVHDDLAFLIWKGSKVVDIADPMKPVEVKCSLYRQHLYDSRLFDGRYAFTTSGIPGGIRITDTFTNEEVATYAIYSDPKVFWHERTRFNIPFPSYYGPETYDVISFDFDEGYLYLLNKDPDGNRNIISLIELGNPAEPKEISTVELVGTYYPSLNVAGNFLFLHSPHSSTVTVYDISDKQMPRELFSIPSSNLPVLHNRFAYFLSNRKIEIWDLEKENGPEQVGQISIPGVTDTLAWLDKNRMAFIGNYLYFANGPTLYIFDNLAPSDPILIDQIEYPTLLNVDGVAAAHSLVVASVKEEAGWSIQKMEVDEPGQMGEWRPLMTDFLGEWIRDITLFENQLFAMEYVRAVDGSNIYRFDVEAKAEVSLTVPFFQPDVRPDRVLFMEPYLFYLERRSRTQISLIDYSVPVEPVFETNIFLDMIAPQDLAVADGILYMSSNGTPPGLSTIDITDIGRMEVINFLPTGTIWALTVGDGFLFGLGEDGVTIFDIQSSPVPTLVGSYQLFERMGRDIAYADGVLYFARADRPVAAVKLDLDMIR